MKFQCNVIYLATNKDTASDCNVYLRPSVPVGGIVNFKRGGGGKP